MKTIELTKGKYAIVDDADYPALSKHSWCIQSGKYAACRYKNKLIMMHRFIMKPPKKLVVDHINKNGFDNRRSNLRVCTQSQNSANSLNKSDQQYRGVGRMRRFWQAYIVHNYKKIHLGTFTNQEQAARCYDKAAIQIFGPFATTNFKRTPTGV